MKGEFGKFIEEKRKARGMTLRGLAAELDIAPAFMSDIEKGHRYPPKKDKLEEMAIILRLNEEDKHTMFDLAGEEKENGVSPDLPEYIMANDKVRTALRMARYMIHYNYSPSQLEAKAEDLLRDFDPERLKETKHIDVYAVIEKCLNVPYDWKYLTPDQSILGMTAFKSGYAWVWPAPYYEDGMKPEKAFFEEGTIVIDSTLTEYKYRGSENFTVMHLVLLLI